MDLRTDWLLSRRADWRRFSDLSSRERRLLVCMVLLVPTFVLAHRLLGLNRVQWVLNRSLPRAEGVYHSEAQAIELARSVSRIVRIAATRGLCHATCLQQSVLVHGLLTRHGVVSELRIGVSRRSGRFAAHAWVECLGQAVNEAPDVAIRYAPFPRCRAGHANSRA